MLRNRRTPLWRALASVLTGALIASAALVGVAAPASAADGPSISAPDVPRAGGTVTVSGAGFSTDGFGIYLGVRQNGASTDEYTVWIDDTNAVGEIPGMGATAPMNVDGSFSVSVPVAAYADGVGYSIITRKAHGGVDPTQSTTTPLSYEAAPATATTTTLAVSPAGSSALGEAVTLSATISPAAEGSVEFFDGTTSLGSSPVSSGSASLATSSLGAGTRSITAAFVPADSSAYASSTADAVSYVVTSTEPVFTPAISVFLADGVTPYTGQKVYTDDVLVVRGAGFDPTANVGGRGAPIPNTLPQGTYVVLGSFLSSWQPSAAAPSSARKTVDTKWALSETVLGQVPSQYQNAVRAQWTDLADDGSFETTLTAKNFADALSGGNWGVYTYGAGGGSNAAQELSVAIDYVGVRTEPEPEPETTPTVTVTPNADLDPAVENVVTVTGKNFVGASAVYGAYVLFGETSVWSGGSALPGNGWIAMNWVQAADITDGAFTVALTIPAGTLDPTKSYQVVTSAAHELSATDRSLDTFTPVSVADPVSTEPAIFLSADSVQQGGTLEVRGTGFPVGELVTVTVNSDPITLASALVGGSGSFAVSGTIPRTFATGNHTVVASVGEIRAESALTVTAATVIPANETPAVATCVAQAVSGATIQWNVKESFRTYIEGPIAKGSYSIGWGSGTGAYSTETDRGRVGFGGSATFTGHSGLLDLTISNPRIQINSATSASLIVNVTSKGFNGTPDVSQSGVVFATLSLPAASESAGRISWSGASATLTSAGAAAFAGFYEAGTALDPVSFTLPLGAEVPCDSTTTGDLAATGGEAPLDVMWMGLGMLVLGAGIFVMRRKTARV